VGFRTRSHLSTKSQDANAASRLNVFADHREEGVLHDLLCILLLPADPNRHPIRPIAKLVDQVLGRMAVAAS
jgi:hypothetical protein